jgi:membrane protease YdiL (CAAX protease family)
MEAPPVLSAVAGPPELPVPTPKPAWRWAVMLLLLASYPLALGLLAEVLGRFGIKEASGQTTILPGTTRGLLFVCVENVGIFALLFAAAWAFGRASLDDLFARWRRPWLTLGLGAVWSVALRLVVGGLVGGAVVVVTLWKKVSGGEAVPLDQFRPKLENLLSTDALHNPVYLLVTVTLVSFVVAGLREELWRAGMLAAFRGLLPARWQNRWGQAAAILFAAVIFGLGHLPQGAAGVLLTGLLGIGLGSVMLLHRSLWVAVLAHGFFDATSFLGIWALGYWRPEMLKQIIPG